MSFVAQATDLSPPKAHLDSYTPRNPGSLSLPPSPAIGHHFSPRSFQAFNMAQPAEPLAATTQSNEAAITASLPAVPALASSSSTQPLRSGSPLLPSQAGSFPTSFDESTSTSIPLADAPHARSHSADGLVGYRPHTPDAAASSRANSLNYGKTIKVVQWTPQGGEEGTQVTIILDSSAIRLAQSSLHNPAPPVFGNAPTASSDPSIPPEVNRSFLVLFGQAPAVTEFTRAQAIDGNGVGQSMSAGPNEEDAFVVLTTFTPPRQKMGPSGDPILVVVQIVDESATVLESCIIGTWDAGAAPATPSRYNALKRPGEELVGDRDAPGMRSPSQSQLGSPTRGGSEWQSPSIPQQTIPAIRTSSTETDEAADPGVPPPAHLVNGQPELIRTSQIQAPKIGYGASYSHKVILKLQGDLNTMAMGWTNEEWQNRRRLIQFWPQQDGNLINVAFRPVPQAEWQPNSITVSCIFRDEWNECFVTSVDTIYLLEALVGSRFSVEEKNRIRRNLEGFKPMTVSKSKPDAEPFFKLIMGFPQPKPRNIEKDVKVFPWKILSNALKKIMSKYSANYPMSGDGAPPPAAVASAADVATSQPILAVSEHLAAPVSPHLISAPHAQIVQGSPHIVQSPQFAHVSTPHLSHTSTPHLNQSPHLSSSAFVPRSPHLDQHLPHSPNLQHSPHRVTLAAPISSYTRGPYDIPASYDTQDYSVSHPGVYAPAGPSSAPSQLFPSAEDYGVPAHHLGPPPPAASLNHLRSYSEGLPRSVHDPNAPGYAPIAPGDAGPHSYASYESSPGNFYAQSQQEWGAPVPAPAPAPAIDGAIDDADGEEDADGEVEPKEP
ncbi:hypothetical protein JCM10212_002263 [Sporobolomyces blumeae]